MRQADAGASKVEAYGGGGVVVGEILSLVNGAASSSRIVPTAGLRSSGRFAGHPRSSGLFDGIPESAGTIAEVAGSSGIGGGVLDGAGRLFEAVGCSETLRTGKGGCVGNRVVSGSVVVDEVFLGLAYSRAKSLARLLSELLGVSHPYISASLFPAPVLRDVLALDLDVPILSSVPSLLGECVLAETDNLCR